MKLDGINIALALLILISISVICHLKQWIPSSKNSAYFSDISRYARLGCPYGSCAKEECSVIHAQLPDELVRGCGADTSPTAFTPSDAEIKAYLKRLYMAEVGYAMQNGTFATTTTTSQPTTTRQTTRLTST